MSGDKDGIKAAIEVIGAACAPPPMARPVQAALPLPATTPDAEGAEAIAALEAEEATERGPGRPKGARNRRTEDMVRYLLARYPSPLQALAELYSRPVDDVALALGREHPTFENRLEILKLQVSAAERLAPYLHQKQAIAVTVDETRTVRLVIEDPTVAADLAALPGDDAMVIQGQIIDQAVADQAAEESEENQ